VAPTQPTPADGSYVVQPGDTLFDISARFGLNYAAVLWANRWLPNPDYIMPGTQIVLTRSRGVFYRVQRGDNWSRIFARFGVPPSVLQELNGLDDSLEAGAVLFVPLGELP
jgi:LysM repeat protein